MERPGFVSERAGGGVCAAYRIGYPTSSTIRVWEVGTSNTSDVTSPSTTVDSITLTAAPQGRLWLSWRGVGDGLLYVQTNATGKAAFTIGRKVKSKTYKATATAPGYARATAKVKVT